MYLVLINCIGIFFKIDQVQKAYLLLWMGFGCGLRGVILKAALLYPELLFVISLSPACMQVRNTTAMVYFIPYIIHALLINLACIPDKASDLFVLVAAAVFVFAEVVAQFPVVVVACWKYAAAAVAVSAFAQSTVSPAHSDWNSVKVAQ